jgi:hypothetical protein
VDFTLVARGRWFNAGAEDASSRGVELSVYGEPPRAPDEEGALEFRWAVSASALVSGDNEFRLHYSEHWVPSEHRADSDDRRLLAIAWESFELRGVEASAPPERVSGAVNSLGSLLLPTGSRVDYFLRFAARTGRAREGGLQLEVASAEPLTEASESLLVELEVEGKPPVSIATLGAAGAPARIPLALSETVLASGGIVRVSLRVARESALGRDTLDRGVRLSAPALVGSAVEAIARDVSPVRPATRRKVAQPRPHVLLYVVDTLRADHLGAYGYAKPVSPRLDAWSRNALVFENAYANSSWT